jgi:probable HAF family extracellular repeat protein
MSHPSRFRYAIVAALLAALPAARANSYVIVDLGRQHDPVQIDKSGNIAGDIARGAPGNDEAIVFRDGRWHHLPSGPDAGIARGINASGTVVGNIGQVPAVWARDAVPRQIALPPGAVRGEGLAIAGDGTVVGDYAPPGFPSGEHCFRTTPDGVSTDLGLLGSGDICIAQAINRKGWIAGEANVVPDLHTHAFLWKDGQMRDLGRLPGDTQVEVLALNEAGKVVGRSSHTFLSSRAFLWEDGRMVDLGAGSGFDDSAAFDINVHGDIVGSGYVAAEHMNHAVRFTHAGVVRLEDEVVELGDWRLEEAHGINASGVIVGWGHHLNHKHGFMLVPQPAFAAP